VTAVLANVLVIQYPNFTRTTQDSRPALGASRRLLLAFVSAMREARLHHILIDMRPVASTPLLENRLWQPGATAGALSAFAEQRVALLVPPDEHDGAQFVDDIARVEGASIQVFTSFDAAIDWLILREQPGI
jgi:hypothetical protein